MTLITLWRSVCARSFAKAKADRKLIRAKARELRRELGMKPSKALRG